MVWMAGLRGVIAFICALGFPNKAAEGRGGVGVWGGGGVGFPTLKKPEAPKS